MNQLEGLLLLLFLPLSLMLSGYWLASLLTGSPPLERLAFALPCGLAVLLAGVAAFNFLQPLAAPLSYVCLAPALLTLLLPRSRRSLWRDLAALAQRDAVWVLVAMAVFFALLLLPALLNPALVYYDGTSNHDGFFWISGAEHLKRHTYMEMPMPNLAQPLTYPAGAIIGWKPPWGRMGGEGLLALASSVIGVSPLKLYLYATASLAFVWFAAVYLGLRTFVTETPGRLAGLALVGAQPIFVFFHTNANLPNLLGALTGAAATIATERAARAGAGARVEFTAWATLAALSLHGLLCSYPEMVPFVLLPCALLWLRPWFTQGPRRFWGTGLLLAAVLLAGLVGNPITAMRAVHGFLTSYAAARTDIAWANLFDFLDLSEYVPAFFTLSIPSAKRFDLLGWPLSLVIVASVVLAFRASRDRFGFLAALAGAGALLAYTLATGFTYGWQKTVQFAGVFVAMAFPTAAFDGLGRLYPGPAVRRSLVTGTLLVLSLFLAYATIRNCVDVCRWGDRKMISDDWFVLRDQSRTRFKHASVLVEAASFRMAFFHSMWTAYFMPESYLSFGTRGEESGGYLRQWAVNERNAPPPVAVLVGRPWADTFDANSPRLLTGREYTLLQKNNRMLKMAGVYPLNGLPEHTIGKFTFEILPHSPSALLFELLPRHESMKFEGEWQVTRLSEGAPDFASVISTPPPWHVKIPLIEGRPNLIEVTFTGSIPPPGGQSGDELPIGIRGIRIENNP